MSYLFANQTTEKETLYFIKDLSLLFIVGTDKKVKHTICGDAASYLYQKMSSSPEKKIKIEKLSEREKKVFYANLSSYTDKVIETMANYEMNFHP